MVAGIETGDQSHPGGIVRVFGEEPAAPVQTSEIKPDWFCSRASVLNSQNLPPLTRLLLHTIACHMDDAGHLTVPSLGTLCEQTGLSKREVNFHFKIAKVAGYPI